MSIVVTGKGSNPIRSHFLRQKADLACLLFFLDTHIFIDTKNLISSTFSSSKLMILQFGAFLMRVSFNYPAYKSTILAHFLFVFLCLDSWLI